MRVSSLYKAPKGLIRINAEIEDNVIVDIKITGDFFMLPEDSVEFLEKHLRGVELEQSFLENAMESFYAIGIVTPAITKEDFVNAVLGVKNASQTN